MPQSAITFVINGNAYKLRPGDAAAASAIPAAEREQLMALLETLKGTQHASNTMAQPGRQESAGVAPYTAGQVKPERLGAGDADALMARLVMEENRHKKPVPTRQSLYKWIAIGGVVVILLVVVL